MLAVSCLEQVSSLTKLDLRYYRVAPEGVSFTLRLRQESVVLHNSYSSLFLYPFHITRNSIQPFYVAISKLHETYAHYFHPLRPLF